MSERVLETLRSYHAVAWPAYRDLAAEAYGRDDAFARALDEWARAADVADERFAVAAKQYALLLAAGALRAARTADAADVGPGAVRARVDTSAAASHADPFAAFPESDRTEGLLADLLAAVDRAPALPDDALAGELYEELLAADERKALGQYYTPPTIAAAVCAWAVRSPADDRLPRVLDPAAGSGTFAVAARDALADLADGPAGADLLDRITAVDVEPLPLHLTALRLGSGSDGSLHHGSFFDLAPEALGQFDAVVGNPPYIRQEDVDADRLRAHLAEFGPSGATPYLDGSQSLSRRSDAYVYFVTYATRFLRDGGRLGVVLPAKWLTTRYGEPFQEFLFEFYRVEAVVGFAARAFEDALVDTVLLLAERREREADRRAATTTFLRVEEPVSAATLLDAVDAGDDGDGGDVPVRDRPGFRRVAVDQARLADAGGGKLAPYLQAPAEFIRLLEHPQFTELGELGDVHRGVTTGANDFFFLAPDDRERWAIPDRFLAPAVRSSREVEGQVVRASDVDRWLLDVHDYVVRVARETGDDADLAGRVRDALARDGHDALCRYVEWGESRGYHERRTCAARRVWFDLGPLDPPEVLHPKFFDERVAVVWNPDGLVPGNAVDCVSLASDVDEAAAMGVLDSTVHAAMLECWGRTEGGGALQLMTYELASLPVLDVRALDAAARERLADCHERLVAGDQSAGHDLDRAVLDALDADLSVEQLRDLHEATVRRRVGGSEAGVLVERGVE